MTPAEGRTADSFGDWQEEARQVRHGLACIELGHLAVMSVRGRDGLDFLHRMLSADIRRAEPGRAVPAAFLTSKARVIAPMTVVPRAHETLCVVPRRCLSNVLEQLERYVIADDVELSAGDHGLLGIYGPGLADCAPLNASPSPGRPLAQLEAYRVIETSLLEHACTLVGDDQLATPGLLVIVLQVELDLLRERLERGGARRCGWLAYESCRVEAGTPAMGSELSEDVLILEAGQLARVSFDKGCYPGQEPVCRIHSRGQVNRLLVGLQLDGDRVPPAGEPLCHPDKADAGQITSAAWSVELARPIALAYVHRKQSAPGTQLQLVDGARATVVELPQVSSEVWPVTRPRFGDEGREEVARVPAR